MESKIKDLQELGFHGKYRLWESYLRKYDCNIVAELGICEGKNFGTIIKSEPTLAIAIDVWKRDGTPSRNDRDFTQEQLDEQYAHMKDVEVIYPFVKVYREYTFEAVKHFPDEYFDFVYIDADHTYESVLRDIRDWYPKVKKGGTLVGDDYRVLTVPWTNTKFGVIEAVNQFTKEMNLTFFQLPNYGWGIIK